MKPVDMREEEMSKHWEPEQRPPSHELGMD